MSEDEFVVLVEHAGLVDSFDGVDSECVERRQLLQWLENEGVALFRERFLTHADDEQSGDDAKRLARVVLDKMIEKRWIAPLRHGAETSDDEPTQLYALRLSTTDAYRIYIEKDAESTLSTRSMSGRSLLDSLRHDHQPGVTTPSSSSVASSQEEVTDAVRQLRIREKMWQDCFPTCSESCKQLYFSFENPTVVLYATLGLNLIGNGISSVPAFSRELRSLDISHEDRSVIIGFLSRAFPSE